MIPIVSSLLIVTTPYNFDGSELPEFDHNSSSVILADEDTISIEPSIEHKPFSKEENILLPHQKDLIKHENTNNQSSSTDISQYLSSPDISNVEDGNKKSSVDIAQKKSSPKVIEPKIPDSESLHLISQATLSSKNTEFNPIPIPVENPPQIKAEELGKPLSLTTNNSSSLRIDTKSTLKFNTTKRLITTSRKGKSHQFNFDLRSSSFEVVQNNSINNDSPSNLLNVVEILADEQEYLDQQQIIKARGNVVIRFSNGILIADQVLVNLVDRIAVAEGNVTLERGEQSLRGDRFEYYFVQDQGVIFNANGEIYQPSLSQDFRGQTANNPLPQQPLSWQFEVNQPLRKVVSAEGFSFAVGSIREYSLVQGDQTSGSVSTGGQVNRFRFQAERVDFDSDSWDATNIRITNDPFSPPEFEIRADTAKLRNISPFQDELTTTNSRLVFDQRVSIPLFQDRLIFDRRDRRPGLFSIGFDGEDLGGLYIERDFEIYTDEKTIFTLTPQILLQRAFFPDSFVDDNAINPDDNGGLFNPSSYGLVANLITDFNDRTNLTSILNFTGLDLDNIDNRLRATVQLNYKIGNLQAPYNTSLQYNYRDRLFNGSLGFQTVQQSYGLIATSPYYQIGKSSFGFVYQGSIQNVTADTDRRELLGENPRDNLTNLTRFQAAGILNGNILLWSGQSLPATPEEGLKYTSTPVAPYLSFNTGLTGVSSYYSNGDLQPTLTATVGLQGQFGHFSNPFFDYTGFNVSFSQGFRGDQSPFYFDRFADDQVLSLGLTQQLYGPIRAGLQSFINVKTNQEISTDYFIEYSRRTHNIIIRYNPVLEIGSVNLRISDFNWDGNAAPFGGTGIRPVVDGVTRND
ncbi:DUF3769 domain-containing protein [Geminocystis sp. NIES-3709]|uniref:DUF3769 domain-containing protein n=1 Tax=Geminocystis sp. NIES-3709 TaxID=1617448 RepID=UPI0005FC4164|nr:DUF3769 domain-containing protein [Geminocystis sp. NIES-3709]BAQ64862.1 hypothetical protein GM3709_1627 [Geminocystis sp. NIES-3709]